MYVITAHYRDDPNELDIEMAHTPDRIEAEVIFGTAVREANHARSGIASITITNPTDPPYEAVREWVYGRGFTDGHDYAHSGDPIPSCDGCRGTGKLPTRGAADCLCRWTCDNHERLCIPEELT